MREFDIYLRDCQSRINDYLVQRFENTHPRLEQLFSAMRYSVTIGGKRVRPVLAYASCEALGGQPEEADVAAAAVELVHAYSLIHDDLPAMDNDDLRRGQPTCHRAYDEATAILAGDALQAEAFELLSAAEHIPAQTRLRMVQLLASAAGPRGMVGGQAIDLAAVGQMLDVQTLEDMHRHKTGALISASVQLGALASDKADEQQLQALDTYAGAIGLAFQVQDDILDVEGDTSVLGKQQGADAAREKPTYPALLGLQGAHDLATELRDQATAALQVFDARADRLRQMADYVIKRQF